VDAQAVASAYFDVIICAMGSRRLVPGPARAIAPFRA
jgi:hypothetical protein